MPIWIVSTAYIGMRNGYTWIQQQKLTTNRDEHFRLSPPPLAYLQADASHRRQLAKHLALP